MKDTDHHIRRLCGPLGDRANDKRTTGCAWRGENLDEVGEEGRKNLLQLRLQHLLQLLMRIGLAKRGNKRHEDVKSDTEKAPDWAGATRFFRLSAAQKVHGVAPARHAGSVTVFWPRAG